MKAIIAIWECEGCGALMSKEDVFTVTGNGKHSFTPPKKCACDGKKFTLNSYRPATAIITEDKLGLPADKVPEEK